MTMNLTSDKSQILWKLHFKGWCVLKTRFNMKQNLVLVVVNDLWAEVILNDAEEIIRDSPLNREIVSHINLSVQNSIWKTLIYNKDHAR